MGQNKLTTFRLVDMDCIRIDNVLVDQFEYGLQIQLELTFLPDNLSDVLSLQFNRDLNSVFAT
jgi:hypothetical protein